MRPLNDYFLHTGPLDISLNGLLWRMVVPDNGTIIKLAWIMDLISVGNSAITLATPRGALTAATTVQGAAGSTGLTNYDGIPVEPNNGLIEGDELQLNCDGNASAGVTSFIVVIRR